MSTHFKIEIMGLSDEKLYEKKKKIRKIERLAQREGLDTSDFRDEIYIKKEDIETEINTRKNISKHEILKRVELSNNMMRELYRTELYNEMPF